MQGVILIIYCIASTLSYCLYAEYRAGEGRTVNTTAVADTAEGTVREGMKTTEAEHTVGTVEASTLTTRAAGVEREMVDESNIMRDMLDTAEVNTETNTTPSRSTHFIPKNISGKDLVEEEDGSWEDFGWETTTKMTVPPSLLKDVGGKWDDFQKEWEDGWE